MRISKQVSGNTATPDEASSQGRGEYEWADLLPDDPTRDQLLNCRILLRLPSDVVLDTACEFASQGNKWRIRAVAGSQGARHIHPVYHLAVALLMPCPTRQEQNMGSGLPVLRSDEYIMCDIIAGHVPAPVNDRADVEVRTARVANFTVPAGQDIDTAIRFAWVQYVWANRTGLPEELAALLEQHEVLVRGGNRISSPRGRQLVTRIQAETAEASRDLAVGWATRFTDPLQTLLDMLGFERPEPAAIPIDQIPPDQPEIRRREIARQRRLAAARGPESGRFRRQVRAAYRSTCAVCGLSLPQLWDGGRAGVDSAHILPDSEFDLNHPANGVCLCKLHHWAFDEGLIEIRYDPATGYSVAIPDEARARAAGPPLRLDVSFLDPHIGPIPTERLPADPAARPAPAYLRRLHDWLYP